MSEPIIEQIALAVKAQLDEIVEGETYSGTLTIVRPTKFGGFTPVDGAAVLTQGTPLKTAEVAPSWVEWTIPFTLAVCIAPPESSETAVDTLANRRLADVHKCIAEGSRDNWGNLAIDTTIADPDWIRFEGYDKEGIAINFQVRFRTAWDDPYSQ